MRNDMDRGLSFLLDGDYYLVDVGSVQKVVRNMVISPVPTAPAFVVGIGNLKGQVITILDVGALIEDCVAASECLEEAAKGKMQGRVIVCKPTSGAKDQVGLLIEALGELIGMSENDILPPPGNSGEDHCEIISGLYEAEGIFYRLINIDSFLARFI